LTSRRADAAIVDIHDLGLAAERRADVVGVGGLVQEPLAAVIARERVRRPRKLEGRRVGVAGLPSDDAVLRAVMRADRGDPAKVRRTTIGFSAVPALASGRVAAATAFWNAEGVALRRRGVATHEFRLVDYAHLRYPELILAVRRQSLASERPRVAALVAALRAGTDYGLRTPAPVLSAINRASGGDSRLEGAEFEATRPALSPPLALDRAGLEAWGRFAVRFGLLRSPPDLRRTFDFGVAER